MTLHPNSSAKVRGFKCWLDDQMIRHTTQEVWLDHMYMVTYRVHTMHF